jgi:hypothetical protein
MNSGGAPRQSGTSQGLTARQRQAGELPDVSRLALPAGVVDSGSKLSNLNILMTMKLYLILVCLGFVDNLIRNADRGVVE